MDHKSAGTPGTYPLGTEVADVHLRLVVHGEKITGYAALEPEVWQFLGDVNSSFQDASICLGVTNGHAGGVPPLVGRFDFIEINAL